MPLIVFDLDGTLFRTETIEIAAVNKALRTNGFNELPEKVILDSIGLTLHEFCKSFNIDDEHIEKFKKDLVEFEIAEVKASGKLYEGTEEFLKRLKNKGHILCICSNGSSKYVNSVLDSFGLTSLFDDVWSHMEGYSKAEALAVLQRKFEADTFIMVGDRACDIEAAKEKMGISIGMTYGFGNDEVFAADHTSGSIQELEDLIKRLTGR